MVSDDDILMVGPSVKVLQDSAIAQLEVLDCHSCPFANRYCLYASMLSVRMWAAGYYRATNGIAIEDGFNRQGWLPPDAKIGAPVTERAGRVVWIQTHIGLGPSGFEVVDLRRWVNPCVGGHQNCTVAVK